MRVNYTTPLPVDLTKFTASTFSDNEIKVEWSTATEVNSRDFILFGSIDGINFNQINLQKGAGYSNSEINYDFIDREINSSSKVNYYKLLQTDFDGASKEYGPISLLRETSISDFGLFPNPANELVNFYFNQDIFNPDVLIIYDLKGNQVASSSIALKNSVNIQFLTNGVYLFKAYDSKSSQSAVARFVKY
jgi:hypothetical protein